MTLFCDTSALLKLYVSESGTDDIQALVEASSQIAACRISWAEAWAGFARKVREAPAVSAEIETAKAALTGNWKDWLIIDVTQPVVEIAGEFGRAVRASGL